MAGNYSISKPAEIQHDELFRVDKRVNGLTINPNGSHVREVADVPGQWAMVAEQAGAQILSSMFPGSNVALQAHGALVRSALRGQGRGRDR